MKENLPAWCSINILVQSIYYSSRTYEIMCRTHCSIKPIDERKTKTYLHNVTLVWSWYLEHVRILLEPAVRSIQGLNENSPLCCDTSSITILFTWNMQNHVWDPLLDHLANRWTKTYLHAVTLVWSLRQVWYSICWPIISISHITFSSSMAVKS